MQGLLEKVPELVIEAGWGGGIDRADSSYTFVPFRDGEGGQSVTAHPSSPQVEAGESEFKVTLAV